MSHLDVIPTHILERLYPISDLSTEHQKQLSGKAQIMPLKAAQTLYAAEQHRWLLYVLDGKVTLFADGKEETIEPNTLRARYPIFEEGRLKGHLQAASSGRLLTLDRNLYHTLREHQSKHSYEVEDMELTEIENQIFVEMYHCCLGKVLRLPVYPDVSRKLISVIDEPELEAALLTRIVQFDLGLTAGLLRTVNASLYGGISPAVHTREAISRLGLDNTRKTLNEIASGYLFKTQSTLLKKLAHDLWKSSLHISALSYAIARHVNVAHLDRERAMLTGFLADIGKWGLIDYLAHKEADFPDEEQAQIVERLNLMVGEMIAAKSLGLGDDMVQVIKESRCWQRLGSGPAPDYTDVVLAARFYYLTTHAPDISLPPANTVSALQRLSLDHNSAALRSTLFKTAQLEINRVTTFLKEKRTQGN